MQGQGISYVEDEQEDGREDEWEDKREDEGELEMAIKYLTTV